MTFGFWYCWSYVQVKLTVLSMNGKFDCHNTFLTSTLDIESVDGWGWAWSNGRSMAMNNAKYSFLITLNKQFPHIKY